MTPFIKKLTPVVERDPRYAYEAYEFVFQALDHTLKTLGRELPDGKTDPDDPDAHVSGRQLVEGICAYARQEFGLMACVVFRMWGVRRTNDFGEIVFNLIDAKLMNGTPDETRDDFHELFDLDEALMQGFRIVLEED
ncbi:MAG: hypothetical protein EXR98_14320 [Gemmataceae bacterium]|nr:hypothetical protein [Gemmataceae bacterium]